MDYMRMAKNRDRLDEIDEEGLTRVISLGAGVQSSTLALMASHGEFETCPDAAIFADTGAEPKAVYEWLNWRIEQVSFPVYIVSDGNIWDDVLASLENERFATPPFFTESPSGGGRLKRQCTKEYKVAPIRRKIRELVGLERGQPSRRIVAEQWIGISLDEAGRMAMPRDAFLVNRYPLIERRMSRSDCKNWMQQHGYPEPPESSCVFCPFHSDAKWQRIREQDPEAWQSAVEMDRAIRRGVRGTKEKLYVHRKMIPLEDVDFSSASEHGQTDLFQEDCEGMCGV